MSQHEFEHRATRRLSHGLLLSRLDARVSRPYEGVMWRRSRTVKQWWLDNSALPVAESPHFSTRSGPDGRAGGHAMRERLGGSMRGVSALFALWTVIAAAGSAADRGKATPMGELSSYRGLATVYTFPYREGIHMAVKEINDAGGVLGRPLEFIFRDDKLKPDEAVKAARELVGQEKVDFLAGCI